MAQRPSSLPKRFLRSQKKQTTLAFSPLSSSSPAKQDYSSAVQDRLAKVRYDSQRQRRRVILRDERTTHDDATLPTPEPSSGLRGTQGILKSSLPSPTPLGRRNEAVTASADDTDDDELITSTRRTRRLSNETVDDAPVPLIRTTRRRHSSRSLSSSSPTRRWPTSIPTPRRDAQMTSSPSVRRSGRLQSKQSSAPQPTERSPQSKRQRTPVDSSAAGYQQPSYLSDLGTAESTDEDDVVLATRPTPRRRQSRQATRDDPFIVDDDEPEHTPQRETPARKVTARASRTIRDNFIADDDEVEYFTSDDDPAATPAKFRKLSKSRKTPEGRQARSKKEREELDQDLQDLQDSDRDSVSPVSRTRGGPVTTQRDKTREHFETLKRRRAGEKPPRVLVSDDEEENGSDSDPAVDLDLIGQPYIGDSDTGSVHSSIDTEPDLEEAVPENDAEDDFIDDNEEDEVITGGLTRPQSDIPIRFTPFASAKPRELFPHVVEWLIKNKIAPAFARGDELYELALNRVDDQVKAQAGSRLISAAWGAEFRHSILARPGMKIELLPGNPDDHMRNCDACNRANHPAQYQFRFSGQPYVKRTLEPVEEVDDEQNSEADAYDEHGHILPGESTKFFLGRHCAANADMGHKLTHWKYHLNESLMDYLEEQGVLSPEAIIARDKKNKSKREKEAEAIVDSMEATGKIAELWKEFQNNLDDARLGMEDYEKKGARRGRIGDIRKAFVYD